MTLSLPNGCHGHLYCYLQIDDLDTFGIDWDGPSPYDDDNTVEIPEIDNPISDSEYDTLKQTIDPLAYSDTFEIDLFTSTMQFVHNLL